MGIGDTIGMLEHAYYSVISPEGCASILWKDASKNSQAASTLKMNAEHLLDFKIVDTIIKEPLAALTMTRKRCIKMSKNSFSTNGIFLKPILPKSYWSDAIKNSEK